MPNGSPAGEHKSGREELAFLLPFFGTLLLTPPLINLFVGRRILLFGVPLEAVYLFLVWLFLVGITMVLSRRRPFRDDFAGDEGRDPDYMQADPDHAHDPRGLPGAKTASDD
ncbi:MAG: hypothetical protein WCZ28_10330 [Burkholderiaceae bacterium]